MDKLRNSTQWSIGPSTPWQLTVIKWGWRCSHADHVCFLDDDFFGLRLPGTLFCKHSKYLKTHTQVVLFAYWVANAWKPWKPCMPCMPSMPMSWLKNVHLLKKAKSEIKLHILYAIYWTKLLLWDWRTKLYYGCKLLVKKDTMLDSLNAKERSYDNNTNDNNFTIRKVNLIFVFIVVVWIFFSNKYMIQNPVLTRGMVLYPRWTWLISWKLVMNCILVYLVYPGNPIYCEQKYLKLL